MSIKNIGNLGEADITLDNDCIIVWHNNIGKSTITKILFSVIKAVNIGDKLYEDFKNTLVNLTEQEQGLEIRKIKEKYNLWEYPNTSIFIKKLRHQLYLRYISNYLRSTLGNNYLGYGQDKGGFTFKHKEFKLDVSIINKGIIQLDY